MPIEIVMPRLGWTMETGTVVEWLKHSGDSVEAGDMLFAVESDKAITEVEALDSGMLYLPSDAPVGIEVPVGATIGFILAPNESPQHQSIPLEPMPAHSPVVPEPAPVREGQEFASLLPSASIGRDSLPVSERARGENAGGEGQSVSPRARRIATELGVDLTLVSGTGRGGRIREADVRAAAAAPTNGARPRVSPSVRRMAEEAGLDLTSVASSGPGGRVTRADLSAALSPPPSAVKQRGAGGVRSIRRAISQRMAESAHTVAAVTLTTEADATELVRVRESLKSELAVSNDLLPSYNDLLIRLTARALTLHPHVNASIDGDHLIVHESLHIGLAVDTERGLLVPVVRNADRLGVFEIASETRRLIEATRDGSISREEMTGGTFTITNLGMFDIDAFTPIINLPEAAVLGVGRIVARPVVIDEATEQVGVRKMMALSLTFDHRVVDGAPAARFLQQIKQLVERPMRWLM